MLSENPNYFDEKVADNNGDSSSERSFFLFKKRNPAAKHPFSNQVSSIKPKQPASQRRRGSLRGLLRSRSNSTTSSQIKPCEPEYCNVDSVERNYCSNGGRVHAPNKNRDDTYMDQIYEHHVHRIEQRKVDKADPVARGTRRHSIGTFVRNEQFQPRIISDEVPRMMAPKAPTSSISDGMYST